MEISSAARALGALAQPTRLEAFRALVRAGGEGATPGELAAALDVPPSTLSFHLKELRAVGLVTRQREARTQRHVADFAAMGELLRFLTEQCCRGLALDGAGAPACGPRRSSAPPGGTGHRRDPCDSSSP